MHSQPIFTDHRGKKIQSPKPERLVTWRAVKTIIAILIVAPILAAAATQIDLTSQVKNTLPVANGGTGASSLSQYYLLAGNGTGAVSTISPGSTSGYVLTSNGASANPTFQAPASAPTFYQEVPSGTVNGSNTAFSLAHTPSSAASVILFMNGVALTQGSGADYTISGSSITFGSAPLSGAILLAQYH